MASHGNVDHVNVADEGSATGERRADAGERLGSFAEFWPYYVGEHRDALTRRMHFAGTTAAGLCLAAAIATRRPALVLGALVAGYGPAWASHFFVEKNRPATFKYPLWSLLADFKMWSLIARGAMDAEVARVAAERPASADAARGEHQQDGSNGSAARSHDASDTRSDGDPTRSRTGVLN